MSEKGDTSEYNDIDTIVRMRIIVPVQVYMKDIPPERIEETIWHAYIYARDAHEWQLRKSGDPYIIHPVLATEVLLDLKPDLVSIQACLLHDVVEDTVRTLKEIEKAFGKDVAHICEWLTKLSHIKYRWEERTIWSLRKMLLAMVDDLRVILVKLADRLHNMQTLEHHQDTKKRDRIALETLNIYAPIADRLGIFKMKELLENECFRILYPHEYEKITNELLALREEQDFFINTARHLIETIIPPEIHVSMISHRVKSPYSIFRKLQRKDYSYQNVADLYDLFAIRIVTDTVPHCYETLGIIHNAWSPIPKRFKDYIALPKENGYQSLHTTVIGIFPELRTQPTEIQIRTEEMHLHAELWVAAHFEYSEKGKSTPSNESYWVTTIQSIIKSMDEWGSFMNEMKMNVFSDQIFVFTPTWDVITLPRGSTPIDFAYAIHSEVGNHTSIAKIDGRVVPLDYELHSGESVNIVTDTNKKPSLSWLSFVKTARAKEVIRQVTNRDQRDMIIERWRTILGQYLERNYNAELDKDLTLLKNIGWHELDTKQREDILVQLGNLSRKPSSVMNELHSDILKKLNGGVRIDLSKPKKIRKKKVLWDDTANALYPIIGWEVWLPYKLAKCCLPTEKDRIVASVGIGTITLHRADCINMSKVELDRRIPARWSNMRERGTLVTFELYLREKFGIIHTLLDIFYRMKLNIERIEQVHENDRYDHEDEMIKLIFELSSTEEDYYLFERIRERIELILPEYESSRLIEISWNT